MKKIAYVIAFSMHLASCANPQLKEISAWSAVELPKAQSGVITHSSYYTQLYDKLNAAQIPNKAAVMSRVNSMIDFSIMYEQGKMTREQFNAVTRQSQIDQMRDDEVAASNDAKAFAGAVRNFGNAVYGPEATRQRYMQQPSTNQYEPMTTSCQTIGTQTVCRSQ